MDPNANLAEQRAIVARLLADDDSDSFTDDACRLAELVQAMHEWLDRGGFLPAAWERVS